MPLQQNQASESQAHNQVVMSAFVSAVEDSRHTKHMDVSHMSTSDVVDDIEACASPVIGTSKDRVCHELHQRRQRPQFRQSKRWSKAYGADSTSRPKSAPEHSEVNQKAHQGLGCNITSDSTCSTSPVQQAITSSSHTASRRQDGGFCRTASVPSWQQFKQAHIISVTQPTRVVQSTTPKRPRSARFIAPSETRSSPMRAALPQSVKSGHHKKLLSSPANANPPPGIDCFKVSGQEVHTTSHDDEASVKPAISVASDVRNLDFWNHPDDSRRWSQECRAFLRGEKDLDFNNDWKPEPLNFGPDLSPSSTEARTNLRKKKYTPRSNSHKLAVTLPDTGPEPPERLSSKGASFTKSLPIKKMGSRPMLLDFPDIPVASKTRDQVDIKTYGKEARHYADETPLTALLQTNYKPHKLLKAARSLDSIAQIEARLNSHSKMGPRVLDSRYGGIIERMKNNSSHSTGSGDRSQPASAPPERPLPALPLDQSRSDILSQQSSSPSSSRKNKLAHDVTETNRPHSRMSSVHTIMTIPEYEVDTMQLKQVRTSRCILGNVDTDLAASNVALPLVPETTSLHSQDSQWSVQRARFKVKNLSTERSDKVRDMKRRHIAALIKDQQTAMHDGLTANNTLPNSIDGTTQHKLDVGTTTNSSVTLSESSVSVPQSRLEYLQSRHTNMGSAQDRDSDDDFPHFPAPPMSRSGSRASNTATMRSTQSTQREWRARSSSRRARSKANELHPKSPTTRKELLQPKQKLSQSSIMIMCDTDPTTESFRAGARSPMLSISSRGTSQRSHTRSVHPRPRCALMYGETKSIEEVTGFSGKKSTHNLPSQRCEPVSPISKTSIGDIRRILSPPFASRPVSKQPAYMVLHSDSELETKSKFNLTTSPSTSPKASSARPASKTAAKSRTVHRLRERAVAAQNCDTSTPDAREMLWVISRYAGKGNALARHMLDKPSWISHESAEQYETSSEDTLQHTSIRDSLDDRLSKSYSQRHFQGRPVSGASTFATNGTSTDTEASWPTINSYLLEARDRRSSADSLTDPGDYEISHGPDSVHTIEDCKIGLKQNQKPRLLSRASSPTLHENTDNEEEYRVTEIRPKSSAGSRKPLKLHKPPKIPCRRNFNSTMVINNPLKDEKLEIGKTNGEDENENQHPGDSLWSLERGDLINDITLSSSEDINVTGQTNSDIIGTERLHGVVEGMKLWPELSRSAFAAEVSIECSENDHGQGVVGRTLHSRFYQ